VLIREIVLRPGMVERIPFSVIEDEPTPPKVLSERQKAFIAEQSAAISDPEIRAAFADLMRTSFEKGR